MIIIEFNGTSGNPLKYVLVSASYAPAHERSHELLMAAQQPNVDYRAAETLRTFVKGPILLSDLDGVVEAARGIFR